MTSPDLPYLQPDMPIPSVPPTSSVTEPASTLPAAPSASSVIASTASSGSVSPIVDTDHLALWLGPSTTDRPAAPPAQSLSDLSLRVMPGDRISLTGPSGAGKSVLLRSLALLDKPVRGGVRYRGASITAALVPTYRSAVAYVMQRASLPGETVRDALEQPFRLHTHRERHYDEAQAVALLARAGKPAEFLDKTNANLSGGEAQIAALVRTLLLTPDVLLLDEPTAALDPASAAAVEALIDHWHQPSRAFVWISHDPQQARRIAAIHWRVADGQWHLDEPLT